MKKYINCTGDSTITHYEIGEEFVRVKYKKDLVEYNTSNNSIQAIEEMKMLAKGGIGLYRYIMKNKINEKYPRKKDGIYHRLKSRFLSI